MKTYCIIVCYNPRIEQVVELTRTLLENNSAVIIVDNSENSYLRANPLFEGSVVIPLNENTGIAHAQNIGIKYALESGADNIVFFDQDSEIKSDFLRKLLASLIPDKPMIVAPVYYDKAGGNELPSMKLNKFGILKKVYRGGSTTPFDVDVVMSSGTSATARTFEIGGMMDEDFFIDFVDTEWCLRCRRNGVQIQIVPNAIMEHSLGNGLRKIGPFTAIIYSPLRCYYQIRNSLLLFRKKNIPVTLAMKEFTSIIFNRLYSLFFSKNQLQYIQYYSLAILDGLKGKVGKKS